MKNSRFFVELCLFVVICIFFSSLSYAKILVLSPHPDDEILIASGVLSHAIERGEPIKVVYLTNGDYISVEIGHVRQDEAVASQSYLGVSEDEMVFLGYPDGFIETLFNQYTEEGDVFIAPNGQSATYASRGLGRMDYHSYRFGVPASYNSFNLLMDIEDIIHNFRPDHIITTSFYDSHPDHSASYQALKIAVQRVYGNHPEYVPTLHNAFVWTEVSDEWPNALDPMAYFSRIPNLFSDTGLSWSDRESIDVPLLMQSTNYQINPKYLALSVIESQQGIFEFMERFIHKDEIFWSENVVGLNRPPVPDAGLQQWVVEGGSVYLKGSESHDPDNNSLFFEWRQIGGTPVQLSDSSTADPAFTAPVNLTADEILTFQLVVNDGELFSIPDSVNIFVSLLNYPPVAHSDYYIHSESSSVSVSAPGVLENDTDPEGATLVAQLVDSPVHGSLTLNPDGSFVYIPTEGYVGNDSFTYRASDGNKSSDVVTVTLTVTLIEGALFADDFTRNPEASDLLLPWVNVSGTWVVTDDVLQGSGFSLAYSNVYVAQTPLWDDYIVEGRIKFPEMAIGGGLGGRVNPDTGAHYGVWVYPDDGTGIDCNVLNVIKFRDWTHWSGTPMVQVALPNVGTDWHALKIVFNGNLIKVYYDELLVADVTDNNFDSRDAYLSGGISGDMYTYSSPYVLEFDNIVVRPLSNSPPVAVNDSYNTSANTTLNEAAPGVLSNDSDPEGDTLTVQLVGGPSHGVLTLNGDGSFSYTPEASYVGSDSFTYVANDGTTSSTVATVTIAMTEVSNVPPAAVNDSYNSSANTTFNQAAPGVLSNDSDPEGLALTAQLVGGPAHGSLTLNADGSFIYTPITNYVGSDSFIYRAYDGTATSNLATVTITVTSSAGVLFSDDFSRSSGASDTLAPWVSVLGTWTVENGVLHGVSSPSTYASLYMGSTPLWTDYSVEGQVQLPVGAFGGGLGGRVNPSTGARYSAWIYPDGSLGGSNVLKLVKFRDWTSWNFAPMQQVSLPTVGTAWHTLKLVFNGSRIQVYYDDTLMIDITDNGFDSRDAYLSGGVSADMWTYTDSYVMGLDNIVVRTLSSNTAPVAENDSYSTNADTPLTQAAPGILGNDSDPEGTVLTAQLVSGPSHGVLTLNSDGSFTYTPVASYVGSDSFTYQATDGTTASNVATVTITVTGVSNLPPVATDDSYSTNANTSLNQAVPGILGNDSDPEGTGLTAQLVSGPSHGVLTLNSDGSFTYTPLASYVGSDSFTYQATDGTTTSNLATVTIAVISTDGVLFSDDFSRSPDASDSLAPWVRVSGTWNVTNEVLQGSSASTAYASLYTSPSQLWTDYSVEGQVQLPAGAFGGGIGGRVNSSTGARYGAWIYPTGSLGGSNVLKLVKFRDWTSWNFVPMQEVSLPTVGTTWHTIKLVFNGSQIQVYYDGTLMIDITDNDFDSRAAYLSGGVSGDLWTYTGSYVMGLDNIIVRVLESNAASVADNNSYSTTDNTKAAPGGGDLQQ